jgi:hypothetical protein
MAGAFAPPGLGAGLSRAWGCGLCNAVATRAGKSSAFPDPPEPTIFSPSSAVHIFFEMIQVMHSFAQAR